MESLETIDRKKHRYVKGCCLFCGSTEYRVLGDGSGVCVKCGNYKWGVA